MNPSHIPVLLKETIDYLNPQPGQIFVDGTLGLGGHSLEIAKRIGPQGRLIAIDRDTRSIEIAKDNLKSYLVQSTFVHNDFRNIDQILTSLHITEVDGILLDLGISSFQLDNPERGFSLKSEGPLDMRMDQESYISAYDLINSLSEKEISSILKNFGEERWHNRIARFLVAERQKHPIETTQELSSLVMRAMPSHQNWTKIHPATRTFQAFRIAVNRELEALDVALKKCLKLLKVGGRMGVISFHSLEDRIVKNTFKDFAQKGEFRLLLKKPLEPTEEEQKTNPRSRSARLRVAERIV